MLFGHLYVFFEEMSIYICSFLDCVVCFFDIELHELFIYFGDLSLVHHFICKYFLPFWGLSFCFVYDFLCYAKAFKFN